MANNEKQPLLNDEFLLPAAYRTSKDDLVDPSRDVANFLSIEFNLSRLSEIHDYLWLAGRPMPPRPLHHQRVLGRNIIVTERFDMHLVWQNDRLFLKPIPRCLLEPAFWARHLACAETCAISVKGACLDGCERSKLRRCATGLLFSYTALIMYESDHFIAHELRLVPLEVGWQEWKAIASQLLNESGSSTTVLSKGEDENGGNNSASTASRGALPPLATSSSSAIYSLVDRRFHYGELRLSRLNKIYRLTQRPFLRGYMWSWNTYATFFGDNLALLASATVYLAIVLTAMQVGLATEELNSNQSFLDASVGFTIFCIIGPLGAGGLILVMFVYLLISNLVVTVVYKKKRTRHIERLGNIE